MQAKISIIIPVYNAEKYLSLCLDSIINQTYKNLEIIIINDGSTDRSGEICESYSSKDHRITVIHRENGGLSEARNTGYDYINGEYISFVDNDDILAPKFYEMMMQIMLQTNADIIECDFIKFENDANVIAKREDLRPHITTYTAEQALELLIEGGLKQVVWNKLYRKETINNQLFPKNRNHEDEFWTYKIFGNAKKIVKLNVPLYYYRQHEKSIMGKGYSIKTLDGLFAFEERMLYMKERFPSLYILSLKTFIFACYSHYQNFAANPKLDSKGEFRKLIFTNVKKYYQFLPKTKLKSTQIVWLYFFLISPEGFAKTRNLINIGK